MAGVDPLLLTPEEAAKALRIGRTRLYELLAEGAIGSVRIGHSRRITVRALQAYVDRIADGEAAREPPSENLLAHGPRRVHTERRRRDRRRAESTTPTAGCTVLTLPFAPGELDEVAIRPHRLSPAGKQRRDEP